MLGTEQKKSVKQIKGIWVFAVRRDQYTLTGGDNTNPKGEYKSSGMEYLRLEIYFDERKESFL